MAMKRNNRRAKQRAKILEDITQKLLDNLAQLAKGKTPPERVKAHTDYYYTCNDVEQTILLTIFKKIEEKELTEICDFFAEKQYEGMTL